MTPFSGIATIISFVILIFGWIFKKIKSIFKLKKHTYIHNEHIVHGFAIVVLTTALLLIISLSTYLFVKAYRTNNNIEVAHRLTHPCQKINSIESKKYIILRIDDIQAFSWSDISIQMIQDAFTQNMPVVAGIIPKDFNQDTNLRRFMKNNICNIEIALHGYGHQEHNGIDEFEQISRKDAYTKFKKGIKELETLNDDMISTFIPPNNKISKEAYEELRKDNIIISSEGSMFFDYDVSTWNWDTDMIVEEESIIATCEKKFESGDDLCVIMLHPQDFATVDMNHNPNTYEVYTSLLSEIKKSNISVVTFQQYHQIKTESFFTNSTDLYIGMKSYDVHLLQTYLNQLGFVISEEGDGSPQLEIEDFGPKTKDAVIQFQKKYTLSRTDGYVDQETKNKLRELVSPSYELAYQMI